MKKTLSAANIFFAVLYLASFVLFFLNEFCDCAFMVFWTSHFYCFGAMLFRDKKFKKFDIFKGFACLIAVITAISWLPISEMWCLVPFWVCGYHHIKKVSHHELMGHLYSKKQSPEVVKRDMLGMWIGASLLVTVILALM